MAKMYGFKNGGEKPSAAYPVLPKGPYVVGIKNVKIDGEKPDRQIVLRVDIIEGEYTGYFTKKYEHDKNRGSEYEVKYKGDIKIQIPDPANEKREHTEWDIKALGTFTYCIDHSNPGFSFDGDDQHIGQLKGKVVGLNIPHGSFNGISYPAMNKARFVVADDVRNGIVKPLKDLPARMSDDGAPASAPAADPSGFTPVETDELPF
jgi:hypothetical protein